MSITVKDAVKEKKISYIKREALPVSGQIVKLDRNENTIGFSPKVKAYLSSHANDLNSYPDIFAGPLREKLSAFYDVKPEEILVGNGSFELISLLSQIFINPGDEVIFPDPSFEFYKVFGELAGGKIVHVPLKSHSVSLEKIAEKITDKTKIIWICNPNNPTGTVLSQQEILEFLKWLSPSVLVVIDEAYIDFVREKEIPDLVHEVRNFPNLVLLRTFSKAYGLASARVGYAIANEDLIGQIVPWKIPPNTNYLGTLAAEISLEDRVFHDYIVDYIKVESQRYYRAFDELGLNYIPSNANFIFFHVKREAAPVVAELARRNILVRGGAEYGYPKWIRVTIGTKEENDLFLDSLKEILK